jgi:hypothetical protein
MLKTLGDSTLYISSNGGIEAIKKGTTIETDADEEPLFKNALLVNRSKLR